MRFPVMLGYFLYMAAQRAHSETVLPKPARTPAAIRHVLELNAPAELLEQFDAALDAAWVEARETDCLDPLNSMLKRWWFQASDWCNPQEHRAYLAKMENWAANGIPADVPRYSSAQVRALLEKKHGGAILNWPLGD